MTEKTHLAYFVMELAIVNNMPNYAGGLGVLAADALISCADLGIPAVGITLVYHRNDNPEYGFRAERYLTKRNESVEVEIEGRKVKIVIWQKDIVGKHGHVVPVFFLSSHAPENPRWDRDLTKHLYALDRYTRLGQEAILGIGGVRALEALGYKNIHTYHLNEGHAALAGLELLRTHHYDEAKVRSMMTFTTHTPIPAGHDYFDYVLAGNTLREMLTWDIKELAGKNSLSMTQLAMNLSRSINSVSKRHQRVCEGMFRGATIKNVTNGIHATRWVGDRMKILFDTYLPGWEENPESFKEAPLKLPTEKLLEAKRMEKNDLIQWINSHKNFFMATDISSADYFEDKALTIGFGRRFVPYKRPDLIFRNLTYLGNLGGGNRNIQIIFANRCHPDDTYCNFLRGKIGEYARLLRGKIKIVEIPDYDLTLAHRLVAGCDLWLNTPIPPMEASGTSGMKAALNGALNLSTRDGWWIEGLEREPLSGWGFGGTASYPNQETQDVAEANELMELLGEIVRCYYERPHEWTERMKCAIALISFFNTHRLVKEYGKEIWRLNHP